MVHQKVSFISTEGVCLYMSTWNLYVTDVDHFREVVVFRGQNVTI